MDLASPERWKQIEPLFEQAIDLAPPVRREFLESLSRREPVLGRELDRLLKAHDRAGEFLTSFDIARVAALLRSGAIGDEAETPDTIGRYKLVRRLGGGGMGVVHLAYDPRLGRPVAIKLLRRRLAAGEEDHRLLIAEARAASALDHPSIVPVHEVGETPDGRVFIAMAFCEGDSLAERIARGPLTPRAAADLGRQIAEALAAAHSRGITHRDLKPGNVMLSSDGRVRLVDFGVAKVAGQEGVRRGSEPGTLGYMSPEQTSGPGSEVGPRSDLWALGVVLYEALTGRRPFRADSVPGLVEAIRTTAPDPIRHLRRDVPERLARVIDRCLAKDPADRPTGANEVAAELDAILTGMATGVGRRRFQRWSLWAAAVSGVIVTMVVGRDLLRNAAGVNASIATTVAVLPFTPVNPDTALERLGRELVVTLSSSLAGIAGIRIVEPVTILGQTNAGSSLPLDRAGALARRLGASEMLHGRLTASSGSVRLDVVVHTTDDLTTLARLSIDAPGDDITKLTEATAVALLRSSWQTVTGAVPNPAALSSRSLPALRAYLQGELAIAAGRFRAAPQAFARAIALDSTFWFAYWRYMYALSYHGEPVDSAIVATVYAHRTDFPEPDRRMVEVRLAAGERERIDMLHGITTRFPGYWPAWFELGDRLIHSGPFLGRPIDEAISTFERAARLNPSFLPTWEHMFWAAVLARDTAVSGHALSRLRALPIDSLNPERPDLETLAYYRYLDHLARAGGEPREAESVVGARVLSDFAGSVPAEWLAVSLTNYGFHRAQIELGRRVRAREPRPEIVAAQSWGAALAWAGMGAWDSAFASARRYGGTTAHPGGPLWAFGLASVGAWLGEVPTDSLAPLRAAALESAQGRTAEGGAEIAWLDGLVACAQGDVSALRRQRRILQQGGSSGGEALERSLAALEDALGGHAGAAGRSLAELEFGNADVGWHFRHGAAHPFLAAVNRNAAARWLLADGDTAEAMRLLLLHHTSLPQSLHPLPAANMALAGLAFPEIARLEEGSGRPERARRYRARIDESAPRGFDPGKPKTAPPCGVLVSARARGR